MRTRREQVQAYRFLTRRITSGLLSGEPETNQLPMRRLAYAVFGSVMVATIVFAGVGIYGLLKPGGRRPVENAIILERETGAKYLYLQGTLHPVLNYTSARLILAQPKPAVRTMSRNSLKGVPRGRPVGIPNAPDALPERSALLGLPWSVCTAQRSATSVALATYVFVGHAPAGGSVLGERQGLLVSAGDASERYLVWNDHRLRIRGNATLAALDWAGVAPAPVGEAFLNAVPAGPDLAAPALPDEGKPARRPVAGAPASIGGLYRAGDQHYVMLPDGLSPVGEVMARLRLAGGRPAKDISTQEAGRVLVDARVEPAGFPTDVPDLRNTRENVAMACAGYRGATTSAEQVITVETFEQADDAIALAAEQVAPARGADGVLTADRVVLPGGYAALVSTLPPPGSTAAGNVYLVTDQGVKYPLPRANTDQVQASLGYQGVRPVQVPGSILALVPTAAALDPGAATQFAPPPTVAPTRAPSRPPSPSAGPSPGQ